MEGCIHSHVIPLVSIIIPAYNAAAYLDKCLRSLLKQDMAEWEAIIVNDGSTDGSAGILDSYAKIDSRFTIIHQENSGVSMARNRGIDVARGDYIIFIDADDWVESRFLSELLGHSNQGQADYVSCGYRVYKKSTTKDRMLKVGSREEPIKLSFPFLAEQSPFPWGKMMKTSILRQFNIRFRNDMKVGEDTLFCYQYLIHAEYVASVPQTLYHYKEEGGAWSHFANGEYKPIHYRNLYDICLYVIPELKCYPVPMCKDWFRELFRQTFRLQGLLRGCRLSFVFKTELEIRGLLLAARLAPHLPKSVVFSQFKAVLRTYKQLLRSSICNTVRHFYK